MYVEVHGTGIEVIYIYLEMGGVVRPRAGGHHLGKPVQQVRYLDVKDNNLKELFLYRIPVNSAAVRKQALFCVRIRCVLFINISLNR
jgi:hypothetical protein